MIALKESMNSKESILIALKDTRNNLLMIHNWRLRIRIEEIDYYLNSQFQNSTISDTPWIFRREETGFTIAQKEAF